MKKYVVVMTLVVVTVFLSGCQKSGSSFAIYRLDPVDERLTISEPYVPRDSYSLESEPVIPHSAFIGYAYNEHTFFLTVKGLADLRSQMNRPKPLPGFFALTVNNKVMYVFTLWSKTLVDVPKIPFVYIEGIVPEGTRVNMLPGLIDNGIDPRKNDELLLSLRQSGLLVTEHTVDEEAPRIQLDFSNGESKSIDLK